MTSVAVIAIVLSFQAGDRVKFKPDSFYGKCQGIVQEKTKNEYRVEVRCFPDIIQSKWFKASELTKDMSDEN